MEEPEHQKFWESLKGFRSIKRGFVNLVDVTPPLWCHIRLNVNQISNEEALLHTTFHNVYDEALAFNFFGSADGMTFYEALNEVLPDGKLKPYWTRLVGVVGIRRIPHQNIFQIPADGVFTITKRFTRDNDNQIIGFPRPYPSGYLLRLQISYHGNKSNILEWRLP